MRTSYETLTLTRLFECYYANEQQIHAVGQRIGDQMGLALVQQQTSEGKRIIENNPQYRAQVQPLLLQGQRMFAAIHDKLTDTHKQQDRPSLNRQLHQLDTLLPRQREAMLNDPKNLHVRQLHTESQLRHTVLKLFLILN